jgi:hypothetical protein
VCRWLVGKILKLMLYEGVHTGTACTSDAPSSKVAVAAIFKK